MIERFAAGILARPKRVLAAAFLLTFLALERLVDIQALAPKFDVDPSMTSLLPRDGAALEAFERAAAYFHDDDLLLVVWHADDLFTPQRLAGLKRLTRQIERLPGVVAVDSLASAIDIQAGENETVIDPFLREVPATAAAAALGARAIANPLLRGRLVSSDGRGAIVAVHFEAGLDTPTLIKRLDEIRGLSAIEAGTIEQFVSGPLLVRLEISRILLRDLYRVTPLAVFATLIVAMAAFRSARGVVLPMLGNLAAVIISLAVFVEAGHALNFVTVILPPVIYVVGFAYAIHVVSEFDRHFATLGEKRRAAQSALREIFLPLTLTAGTTAIAFAALALSEIDSIRVFGLYTALGVILAWAGALTVVPAGLLLLPGRPHAARELKHIAHLAARLARFNTRRRGVILGVGLSLAVAALLATTQIKVDTAVLQNFDSESAVQQHFQRIGEVFSGPVPIRILIDADQPDAFKDPQALRELNKLATWLNAQPEVGGVYTLADYIALLHRAVAPDRADHDALPSSRRFVNHLLLVGGSSEVQLFADPAFKSTLVHVRSTALSTAAVNDLAARIERQLTTLPPYLHGQVTGTSYLIARTVDDITIGQIKSLSVALVVVFIVLSLLFGSFGIGALILIPNALPVLMYFGLLGISPITLNLTTGLVACAVFGIAIDDSVHFLSRFALESRGMRDPAASMAATLTAVLRPVTLTTFALGAGFLALTAAELRSQAEFGLLAAATLLFAWLVDITFTPALCCKLRVVPLWERLGWFAPPTNDEKPDC